MAELLVDMVVEDSQPFTLVDGSGFKKLMKALAPSYVLPTRQVCMSQHEALYYQINYFNTFYTINYSFLDFESHGGKKVQGKQG